MEVRRIRRRSSEGFRGLLAALLFLLCSAAVYAGGSRESGTVPASDRSGGSGAVRIVAAENFYGNVAKQIGGTAVSVTSILNNPNVDPHEYESSIQAAVSVANASLVVMNGGGYDAWMEKLLAASPSSSRIVVTAYDIAPQKLPENDHVFYSPDNMEAVARAIRDALGKIDPGDATRFDANYRTFARSLEAIRAKMEAIKRAYAATPIALTETIFLYQADPMKLAVLTPFAFQKAVAEGNDPPADAAVAAERQVKERKVRVLVYNKQTVTKLATRLVEEARAGGIPVVGVTETMPPRLTYQSWMLSQLDELSRALAGRSSPGASPSG